MKGYTEPKKLKCWWPTMPVMHAYARYTTLQMGPHWAVTYFIEVAKAADMCSTLRIHDQYECCTSTEFAGCHPIFFFFFIFFTKWCLTRFSEYAVIIARHNSHRTLPVQSCIRKETKRF